MADPREPLGRLVHEQRLAHEAEQAAAEGRVRFHLGTWEERTDAQREMDMRIASAVAAQAVHDAGLENTRRDAQLLALSAHLPAVRRALKVAVSEAEYKAAARPYLAALEAFGGGQERSDEEGPES